jgi:hypothetical protein
VASGDFTQRAWGSTGRGGAHGALPTPQLVVPGTDPLYDIIRRFFFR